MVVDKRTSDHKAVEDLVAVKLKEKWYDFKFSKANEGNLIITQMSTFPGKNLSGILPA